MCLFVVDVLQLSIFCDMEGADCNLFCDMARNFSGELYSLLCSSVGPCEMADLCYELDIPGFLQLSDRNGR